MLWLQQHALRTTLLGTGLQTTLMDMLIEETHQVEWGPEAALKPIKYAGAGVDSMGVVYMH